MSSSGKTVAKTPSALSTDAAEAEAAVRAVIARQLGFARSICAIAINLRFWKMVLALVGDAKHQRRNAVPVRDDREAAESHPRSGTRELCESEPSDKRESGEADQSLQQTMRLAIIERGAMVAEPIVVMV